MTIWLEDAEKAVAVLTSAVAERPDDKGLALNLRAAVKRLKRARLSL